MSSSAFSGGLKNIISPGPGANLRLSTPRIQLPRSSRWEGSATAACLWTTLKTSLYVRWSNIPLQFTKKNVQNPRQTFPWVWYVEGACLTRNSSARHTTPTLEEAIEAVLWFFVYYSQAYSRNTLPDATGAKLSGATAQDILDGMKHLP